MRKFEFGKNFEEIEIAGEVYKISLKDSDKEIYKKCLLSFFDSIKKVEVVDEKTINHDDSLKLEEEIKKSTLETLDVFFGEGSGDKLYQASGEQTEELFDVIFEVAEMLNDRKEEKAKKYLKKKRK